MALRAVGLFDVGKPFFNRFGTKQKDREGSPIEYHKEDTKGANQWTFDSLQEPGLDAA